LQRLQAHYQRGATLDLLDAIAILDPDPQRCRERLGAHLREQPTLSAAQELLTLSAETPLLPGEAQRLREAVGHAAKPLHRYRCAACGFEAQHYFWQCPGCLSWDSYPPQRLEDL
jgi:lipopolysaccharide biosynthesis regulator YciM